MSSRQLVFSDGKSHKFWNIELEGQSHTVTYGRVGTSGQSQTKDFDDAAAAKKSFDKLVQQKVKKGYSDSDVTATSAATTTQSAATKSAAGKSTTAGSKTAGGKSSAKAKTAAKAAASDPAADVVTEITHVIDLDPADWSLASFRERKPLELGEPKPADIDAGIKRFTSLRTTDYGWTIPYEKLKLPPILAPEEAHFWFCLMTGNPSRLENKAALEKYAAKIVKANKFTGKVSVDEATTLVSHVERRVPESFMQSLISLFSADECLQILIKAIQGYKKKQSYDKSELMRSLCDSFRSHVLPYLKQSEINQLQKRIRKSFNPHFEPADSYSSYPVEHYLAAMLGMHDEIQQVVSSWEDDRYCKSDEWIDHYHRPQALLFGLESAEQVESEWRRLKLRISTPENARGFLACTEYSALDVLADQICRQSNKDDCTALLKVFALVRAPEAAEPMLQCRLNAKTPALARDWMAREIGNAVSGLIDTAGSKGKLADAAIEYLRSVKRSGLENVIADAVKKAGKKSEAAARVQRDVLDFEEKTYDPLDEKTTPAWLRDALVTVELARVPKLPPWANAAHLPPLTVGDQRLSDEQLLTVLHILAVTPVTERHPLLTAIKEHIDKGVRDTFAWRLFELWQEDGSVSKNKWAMGAIGHIGDDGCVMKLTPMVRVWPGESQHARAVFGLECLRGVGTNTALMQLSGVAQKLKFKGLKTKAAAFVEDIAKEKGMTRAELEDRVIPDCGLDEMGRREFSFGSRSFSFVLGGDLKPMVRDESGKIRPNMPKPAAKDDEKIANESLSEWKLIKKQIKEVATLQAGRLEQAMVTGRRWTVDDFESLLVKHPLMTHLVQKLIWGSFDAKGNRTGLFRVTEERDYADATDATISLDKAAQIGLMHPLDLTEAERSTWGEVLSDYEIITPFPQLGREVYSLEKGEEKTKQLARFTGLSLAAPTMVFTLEKLGWVRGVAMDAGCFDEHSKQFPSADVTAVVHYDGVVGMGYIDPDEMLKTESIHFCKGMRAPSGYGWGSEKPTETK
ncbi:WGR domain-containing protein [Rhodopirellula maiorica SM1]|uniref:WGR domain-containing protein n=1 Tax=Rhodopirellula maiorica SM1 TaxID=1265738 RepID=M5RBB1_9BACT|nr:WGR and DUF4132 domain-containing protein [Rhodopirellula maiorica]EMI16331.1 WGR domain-containing protein [Rhodopirellula maiorica SM1]